MDNNTFPNNLFFELGHEPPKELAEDFSATVNYVLRCVADARNTKAVLMRYKDGKTYEEIASMLGLTRQRVHELIQSILSKINDEYVEMMQKGIKKYYDDLLIQRIENMRGLIAESERDEIMRTAYKEGYDKGFEDCNGGKNSNTAVSLSNIDINLLNLSVRTFNVFRENGVQNLAQYVKLGDRVIDFRSFGKGCFVEVAEILKKYGVDIPSTFPRACKKFKYGE